MNFWQCLNLNYPGLETVKAYYEKGNEIEAYAALEAYYARRKRAGFLTDYPFVLTTIEKELPEEILISAKRQNARTFVYDKSWDMEKCFEPITFPEKIDWHYQYNGDPEWMFMLNRQNFLLDLVLAYLHTKEEKYLQTYVAFMEEWQTSETSYKDRDNTSWRTIDTGIRLKNWVKQLEFLLPQKVLSGEFLLKTLASIYQQIHYLLVDFSFVPGLSLSNWRILEFHGAFIAATFFPELKNASEFQKIAQKNLESCLPLQVTNDGFHWEQSFMYHHEVLLNGLEALQIAQNNNLFFSTTYLEVLTKMLIASSHAIAPDFTQISYGDSDKEDMRHLLTLGSLILKPEKISRFGLLKTADFSLTIDFGGAVKTSLEKLWATTSEETNLDFKHEDVGNYFLRTTWSEESSFLFFKNGFLGGGHGHNDLLHVDLFIKGQPVLVDVGRFTYKEGDSLRQHFKESKHHNTITLDQKEYVIQGGSWGNKTVANEVKRPVVFQKDYALLQGMHLGYGPKAVVNRKIIALKKQDLYFISDEIFTEETHTLKQHFHFATPKVQLKNDMASYKTSNSLVKLIPLSQQVMTKEKTELSPSYNVLEPTEKVVLTKELTGNNYVDVLVAADEKQNLTVTKIPVCDMWNRPVAEKFASGYRVKKGKEEFLVLITHGELQPGSRKLYLLENVPIFGKTAICHLENGKFIPTVLEY